MQTIQTLTDQMADLILEVHNQEDSEATALVAAEASALLVAVIEALAALRQRAIHDMMDQGLTQSMVAHRLHLSKQRISQLLNK